MRISDEVIPPRLPQEHLAIHPHPSSLQYLPDHRPVGWERGTGRERGGERVIFAAGQHPYQRTGQACRFNWISWHAQIP